MTDTLVGVSPPPDPAGAGDAEDRELSPAELAAVEDLVRRARQAGIALTGPDGLLKAMTKTVVEAALEEEMADHMIPPSDFTWPLPAGRRSTGHRTSNPRRGPQPATRRSEPKRRRRQN